MANPRTIRESLATRLRTIAGLNVYEGYPAIATFPCAIIHLGGAEPEQTFGRGDMTKWDFEVDLRVSPSPGPDIAQQNLDPYLATSSTGGIFGTIAADRRLNNTVIGTMVKGFRDYDLRDEGDGILYVGAMIDLEIWTS